MAPVCQAAPVFTEIIVYTDRHLTYALAHYIHGIFFLLHRSSARKYLYLATGMLVYLSLTLMK